MIPTSTYCKYVYLRDILVCTEVCLGRRINFMYCALSMLRVVFNLPCCLLSFFLHRSFGLPVKCKAEQLVVLSL